MNQNLQSIKILEQKIIALLNKLKENHLNIIKSKDWFIKFLKRNDQWKLYSDHNQLRITRIIECLRLLISKVVSLILIDSG